MTTFSFLLAANTMTSAISCPVRGVTPSYTFFAACSSPRKRTIENSVSTCPGSMLTIRIRVEMSSWRIASVKAWAAALEAQ